MKFVGLTTIVLAFVCHGVLLAGFEERKSNQLRHIDSKLVELKKKRDCVAAATSKESLKSCKQQYKSAKKALKKAKKEQKLQNINQRMDKLEQKKKSLQGN